MEHELGDEQRGFREGRRISGPDERGKLPEMAEVVKHSGERIGWIIYGLVRFQGERKMTTSWEDCISVVVYSFMMDPEGPMIQQQYY